MLVFLIVGFTPMILAFVLLNTVLRPDMRGRGPDIPPPSGGFSPRKSGSGRPAPKPAPPPGAKKEA